MTYHDHRAPRPAAAPPAVRQPGPVTMALRAMQAELTKPRRVGPVTAAIRTMRAADPAFDLNPDLIALRRALADRIEADIAALDMLGGDPDLDADLTVYREQPDGTFATVGITTDDEPSLCGIGGHVMYGHQMEFPAGGYGNIDPHDLEGEDEHGGDVQDEPHDAEEDDDRDSGCGDAEGALEAFGSHTGHFAAYA